MRGLKKILLVIIKLTPAHGPPPLKRTYVLLYSTCALSVNLRTIC